MLVAQEEIKYGTAEGAFDVVVDTKTVEIGVQDVMATLQTWFPLIKFSNS